MQDLRLMLFLVGIITIIVLLLHGLWARRKERSALFDHQLTKRHNNNEDDVLLNNRDEGVGEVRISSNAEKHSCNKLHNKEATAQTKNAQKCHSPDARVSDPAFSAISYPERPGSEKTSDSSRPFQAIDHTPVQKEQRLVILHVVTHSSGVFSGEALLKSILNCDFQFGDMNIFHRYLTPTGNDIVLFSLANMVNPGFFDLKKMSDFSTPGISIFMKIPCYGDASQNFKLMLQSTQRIADNLGGLVLDDQRQIITPQKLEDYKLFIRNTPRL